MNVKMSLQYYTYTKADTLPLCLKHLKITYSCDDGQAIQS